jgi:zinc transport system substrate-binding protein
MYPLEFIASQVAGPLAEIKVLVPPGVEPHDFELTASQQALLHSADLVFYQSGISPAIDKVLKDADMSRVIDTATLVAALTIDGNYSYVEGADPEQRSSDIPVDPHTWLNPANMGVFTNVFADRMVKLLPANATTIGQAANILADALGELDAAFLQATTKCERREFLTSHDAFRYLADAYSLTQLAVGGLDPEDEPTPVHLAEVSELAKGYGITTIFFEPLVSRDAVDILAADLGLQVAVLDPVEAVSDASPGKDYLEIMYANMNALRRANGCTW